MGGWIQVGIQLAQIKKNRKISWRVYPTSLFQNLRGELASNRGENVTTFSPSKKRMHADGGPGLKKMAFGSCFANQYSGEVLVLRESGWKSERCAWQRFI